MERTERVSQLMKATFDQSTVELTPAGNGYAAIAGDKTASVEIVRAANGKLDLLIDGEHVTAYVSSDGAKRWVTVDGQTFVLTKASGAAPTSKGRHAGAKHDHEAELSAPMPGQVRGVNVSAGDKVTKGQTLLVLEAMKMEIRIQAPRDGIVVELLVKAGQTVEREQILVKMDHG
jgi:biotin carboxyl carrier protein